MLAKKHVALVIGIIDRADFVRQTKPGHHRAGKTCCLLDVRSGPGGHIVVAEFQFFCDAPAHHDGKTRGHFEPRHRHLVVLGQLHDHAERAATRNDGRLVDRIGGGNLHGHDRMAGLMPGREFLFLVGHHHGASLRAHHHLVLGVLELTHRDNALAPACRKQGRFIDEVGEVCARKARCAACDRARIDILGQRHVAHVDLEDLLAPDNVRIAHHDLTVEPAWTQQSGVKNVGPVGRRDDDHAFIGFEPVHLDQQLVQRLLALVIAAAKSGAARTANRVDFIDEDDTWRRALGLLEHVAHTAGAHADKHLDKVGPGNREEWHIGLACHGARNQRLAGTGRADQQRTFRNLAAKALELGRVLQELDHFLQLFLGFIHAGNIIECHTALLFRQQARARLSKAHRPASAAALHLAHHEQEQAEDQQDRQQVEENRAECGAAFIVVVSDIDASIAKARAEIGIEHALVGMKAHPVFSHARDLRFANRDFTQIAVIGFIEHAGIGKRF